MPANYMTSWLTDCPLSAHVGFVLHMWSPVVLATKHEANTADTLTGLSSSSLGWGRYWSQTSLK